MNLINLKYSSIQMSGVDRSDYPDFCDAFIESASWENGIELTESELEQLNDEHPELVNEEAFFSLID